MLYHIYIVVKNPQNESETKLGLTQNQLQDRILTPYNLGKPITINGKTFQPDNIDQLRISRSDRTVEDLLREVEESDRRNPVVVVGVAGFTEYQAWALCEEVTDDLIVGPPGHGANALKDGSTTGRSLKHTSATLRKRLEGLIEKAKAAKLALHLSPSMSSPSMCQAWKDVRVAREEAWQIAFDHSLPKPGNFTQGPHTFAGHASSDWEVIKRNLDEIAAVYESLVGWALKHYESDPTSQPSTRPSAKHPRGSKNRRQPPSREVKGPAMPPAKTLFTVGQTYSNVYFIKVDASGHSTIVRTNPADKVDKLFDLVEKRVFDCVMESQGLCSCAYADFWGWQGDGGLCVIYDRQESKAARTAIKSALKILDDELPSLKADLEELEIKGELHLRMAIHKGHFTYKGSERHGSIHSADLNFVAHLEQVTPRDCVAISQEVLHCCPTDLEARFTKLPFTFEERKVFLCAKEPSALPSVTDLGAGGKNQTPFLVIHSAMYGANEKWIDLTAKLIQLSLMGKLDVVVNNNLLDDIRDDPCRGTNKRLNVRYSCPYGGPVRTKIVDEDTGDKTKKLILP